MDKLKSSLSILLTTFALQVSFIEVAKAQISTGGFSGGTFNFPVDGSGSGGLGGLGDLNGSSNSGGISTGGFSGGTFNFPVDGISGIGNFSGLGDLLPEPIADLFRDIANIVGQVNTFLSELGIEVNLGELGLPDIEQAIELFEQDNQIDIASDVFGTQTGSTVINDDSLRKQYLKDLGNEYAQNSTLSEEGQQNTAEQIELSQETAEISNQYAQDSNGQDVSQNILRNISNQIALQQQLDNMSYFGQQEDKISRSLMLAIQGESVVALDKLTTTRDREAISILKAGTYHQGLLSIPAQHLLTSN
ncbi:hypothetical protein I4641_02455 [Waterburya agarophytonicola K14]|uniref:Uncharacterized protein n=1 Tax=Waterburya agarophytonicola KI4 TaxID=2874699 RepID=A0A964FFU5_9CYAN|nr:hypothetical protein [Waterburya agarophytonicola]MCC0175843.1 hypothetical protein [Waterburya agarophytonicola KI4]